MSMKFNSKAVVLAVSTMVALLGSHTAFASEGDGDGVEVSSKLKAGCYNVKSGTLTESSVNPKIVIGTYKLQLVSEQQGKSYVLRGPIAGSESGEGEGEHEEGAVAQAEEEGPHGGHNFGTDKAIGTFSTEGDSIEVTGLSCTGTDGVPRIIKGIETFKFVRGTGVFTNLASGQISFNLTYDACNSKNNPVTVLKVISGQMCFN